MILPLALDAKSCFSTSIGGTQRFTGSLALATIVSQVSAFEGPLLDAGVVKLNACSERELRSGLCPSQRIRRKQAGDGGESALAGPGH